MDTLPPRTTVTWSSVILRRALWRRALLIGMIVGTLQVAVNQGDHWLSGAVDARILLKSIVSPLIAFAVAFVSAAWSEVAQGQSTTPTPVTPGERGV